MAYTFSKVPQSAFQELVVEAGVVLSDFDPTDPELVDSDIICATTGGITASCVPTFSDWAEDVDNAPNNMLEFKKIDGWDCTLTFTALSVTADTIKLALGAAETEGTTGSTLTTITPHRDVAVADFISAIWFVGDLSDGGMIAIKLMNALSTGGFNLQTGKNAKGQLSVTLTGHVSSAAQDVVPMEFYIAPVGDT